MTHDQAKELQRILRFRTSLVKLLDWAQEMEQPEVFDHAGLIIELLDKEVVRIKGEVCA